MFAVTGLVGLALLLCALRREPLEGGLRVAYLVIVALLAVLAAVGGHTGGELVHGADYLPF